MADAAPTHPIPVVDGGLAALAEVEVGGAGPWASAGAQEAFVQLAADASAQFDAPTTAVLEAFAADAGPAGAVVLRHVPLGEVPPTPPSPTSPTGKDLRSELALLAVARKLGEPIGYAPEHGGSIVQNLVPTPDAVGRQTSTSSGVDLAFHTETAFHPHLPRYLLLLCLRGDPAAATTLASVEDLLPALSPGAVDALRRPIFRTAADESFGGSPDAPVGAARPVLGGTPARPTLCWDEELTSSEDPAGADALAELAAAAATQHRSLVLEAGDLLVVDNRRCVHGRSPFRARFDGTDRWLQRTFVVPSLAPSASERTGRVVTTSFAVAA